MRIDLVEIRKCQSANYFRERLPQNHGAVMLKAGDVIRLQIKRDLASLLERDQLRPLV
jgi:hypothetical protein